MDRPGLKFKCRFCKFQFKWEYDLLNHEYTTHYYDNKELEEWTDTLGL